MDFVVFSMNNSWIVSARKTIFESKNNCIGLRNINDTSKIPLSVYIVDADTIKNKKLLSQLKEQDNILKVYLSSVKIQETALEFPRYEILPSQLTVDIIKKVAEDVKPLLESGKQESPIINKEKAIKVAADVVKIIEKPKEEEEELTDDDFDDMTNVPRRWHRPSISKHSVIYEDEEKFAAFEDRDDLRKIAASNPGLRVTRDEAKAIDREIPEKPVPSLISQRLQESSKVVEAAKISFPKDVEDRLKESLETEPEEEEDEMASEVKRRPIHQIIHENNERADANIGQRQFVEALGFEIDMRAPVIKGKPFEFVEFDDGNIAVDKPLSEYRISKLQKAGLDAWGIVREIKQIKQDEIDIRNQTIKERELKRQKFLQQFEDTQVMVPEIKKKEEEKRKDIFKDLGVPVVPTGPKILETEKEFRPPERPVMPSPTKRTIEDEDIEFKQRDEILKKQEQAKARRLVMETESESVSELFNRRREEQRRLAEEMIEGQSQKKQSLLPDLPSKKLTERSELSKYYEEKNIKRAESKTNLKSNIRPPQEMIEEAIKDEESADDDDEGGKKKKGFWGKFRK